MTFAQTTTTNNVRPAIAAFNGWDGTGGNPGPLDIRNDFSGTTYDIDFYINSIKFLQVLTTGDLNVVVPTNGYKIDNDFVLWHNGDPTNIFVGVNAGSSSVTGSLNTFTGYGTGTNAANSGDQNTFYGWGAGNDNTTGEMNTFVGKAAGLDNTTGNLNVFVGAGAGAGNTTGELNVMIGPNAGLGLFGASTGDQNVFIGEEAGLMNTSGHFNTAVGSFAGNTNGTGYWNTFVGGRAGTTNDDGYYNTFVGVSSGDANQDGNLNTFMGAFAGENVNESRNSFYGAYSGNVHTSGSFNSFFGNNSGILSSSAANNSLFGGNSGLNFTDGENNTYIGYNSGTNVTTGINNSATLGANAEVSASNQIIIGDNNVNVGIGLSGDAPLNKLEINYGAYGTTGFDYPSPGDPGISGLSFRDLTDHCQTESNQGLGVLAVNSAGAVIYVPEIGNPCANDLKRPILSDYEIPLDEFDYYFSGQADLTTNVLVGASCTDPHPYAKFQSYQETFQTDPLGHGESNAGYFLNSTNNKLAIGAVGISDRSEFQNIGVKGIVNEYTGAVNLGVLGTTIPYPLLLNKKMNVGVYGYAKWAGGHTSTHLNYGVVGDLGINCPNPPCNTTAPDAAGYFNGDVQSTTAIYVLSDGTLKQNVQDITNPMDIINRLSPKSYEFNQQQNQSMILSDGTHYGLLAQELESVLPQLIKNSVHPARVDSAGNEIFAEIEYKAVNYIELIPFLIAGMKEQQQTIEAMQAQLSNCCGGGNRHSNGGGDEGNSGIIDIELKNAKSIILNQNVPNPFAEQTTITFFITDDVKKAQIFFYDNKGTILKTVDINDKGAGQINVFAADLSSGNYTYTLIADGKVVDTKKMVKTN